MSEIIGAAARALIDAVVAREFLIRKGEFAMVSCRFLTIEYVAYWPDGNVTMAWGLA